MFYSSRDVLLKLSEATTPQKPFPSDCITLYISRCLCICLYIYCVCVSVSSLSTSICVSVSSLSPALSLMSVPLRRHGGGLGPGNIFSDGSREGFKALMARPLKKKIPPPPRPLPKHFASN